MDGQLEDWEVALIKGMFRVSKSRPALHDQEILSYFTRPGRSINPARVAEIQQNHPRYDAIPEAAYSQVLAFMRGYPSIDDYFDQWRERMTG